MEFKQLYENNHKKIFNFILYGTGNVEDAMDLTSETFLKALKAWPRFEYRGVSPTSWLFKIASRELAAYYRKRSKLKLFEPSNEFHENASEVRKHIIESEILSVQQAFENRDNFMYLSSIIRKLPVKYRVVVYLRFFVGMSVEEISEFLKQSKNTVKTRLRRAVEKLGKEMNPSGSSDHYIYGEDHSTGRGSLFSEEGD